MKSSYGLNAKQKAAILMLAFGEEIAAEILKHMSEEEVKGIVRSMQQLGSVEEKIVAEVLQEFYGCLLHAKPLLSGGYAKAKDLLQKAFKDEKASLYIDELSSGNLKMEAVDKADASTLASVLAKEHPQTIALVLAFCDAKKCGEIIKGLPQGLHTEVLVRLARLDRVNAEVVEAVDQALMAELKSRLNPVEIKKGGVDALVKMLSQLNKESRENMLAQLQERDPELAQTVEERLFTFEDLMGLSDQNLQILIKAVSQEWWKKALKISTPSLKDKIFANMSSRAAQLLQEDMEALPPMRKTEVEGVQQSILKKLRELEEQGLIILDQEVV